jgi:hypothetical protein
MFVPIEPDVGEHPVIELGERSQIAAMSDCPCEVSEAPEAGLRHAGERPP